MRPFRRAKIQHLVRRAKPSHGGPGYSLIELTLVLLILGVLMGLVLGLGRHGIESARRAQVQADLGELHHALTRFHATHDAYPPTDGGAVVAVTNLWAVAAPWAPPEEAQSLPNRWMLQWFLPEDFSGTDPWGEAYRYSHDAEGSPTRYELYSLGPFNPEDSDADARIRFQP